MHWFVNVQNQVYGPYSESQMQAFTMEGRINADSLISNMPAQGFFAAASFDIFALWSGTGQIAVGATSYGQPAPTLELISEAEPKPNPQPITTPEQPVSQTSKVEQSQMQIQTQAQIQTQVGNKHVFLVMAEIRSDGMIEFLQKLQGFGAAQKLSENIWLVKSASSVEHLRNTLSQSLNRQDRLFILDAATNTPAWFNIGADLDSRIRDLWSEDDGL